MAKTKISEYSATANSNTDVASINIDEGCAPSGINNAIRAVMGHLKDFQTGTASDPLTVGGALTTSSTVTHNGGTANGVAYLNGSKVLTTGSALVFDGTNLGLGVTPSAWGGSFKAIEFGGGNSFYSAGDRAALSANAYYNGSAWTYKTTGGASRYEMVNNQAAWYTAPSGTAGNAISFTQAITLDASGNLGIGTTSPTLLSSQAKALSLGGTSATISGGIIYQTNGTVKGYDYVESDIRKLQTASGVAIAFLPAGNEAARIDSSGNLLVGKTSASGSTLGAEMDANGAITSARASSSNSDVTLYVYSTTAAAARFYVGMGGTVYATSTTITGISDQRLKENIRDLDDGLEKVMALQPRKFDWKEGKGQNIKDARGFIAQEFETVFPDMIEEWRAPAPEGEEPYKAVNANLIPTLVKAIQELKAELDAAKARITTLEA